MSKEKVKIYKSSKWEIVSGLVAVFLISMYIFSDDYSSIALILLFIMLFMFPIKFIELNAKDREINELVQILFIKKYLKKIKYQEIKYVKIDSEKLKGYTAYANLISGDIFKIHSEKTKDKLFEKLEPIKEFIKQ